ncbi:FKBP-type peptidyl-prolyl cis-trans isomerase [Brevibacterium iodinum ATCC 49514]|uniref:Peptidyl-prolyl cis-trans isomerase n=1 Tax=Brevibacterium iodinum ATCC 49514 TaxID=1255616 RepID=A0A2H1I3E4_9MICO|nr:FKBP-type peptidyl-prolyl cis-trans isomerase [Brevibacterium iodinum]SMX69634.1 FKBP-type peptidyl-prolyl cis-trans isomerase [Brevibacterium iodinum ATCC 49514]SUW12534.1 FK506-binding protein [Brevibacterium iodinum]
MRTKVLSAIAAGLLLLSACGQGDESEDSNTPPTSVAAQDAKSTSLDDITVDGKMGKKPKVSFEAPLVMDKTEKKVLKEGTGDKVADGEQVTAQMTLVSGTTGKTVESSYDSDSAAGFPMDKSQISEGLYNALIDVKVGSRVMMSLNGNAQQGEASQTLVYVIDIEDTKKPLTRAEGKKADQSDNPVTVKWADDGAPSISKPKGKKPTELESYTTIEGKGDEVKKGQSVAVKYSGWLWDDTSKTFDSNWKKDGQPLVVAPVGEAQVIDGWNEGLVGKKVGDQVVLVVPPDKGYGKQGNDSIPGNSTLIFVVDILSAQG